MYRIFRKDPLARRGKRNQYLLQQTFIALMVMFSFVMQVNANSVAQRLNLSLKNASLKDVMTKIQQQTGYDFIFTQSARDKMIPVTIDVNNVDLSEVLEQIFKKQPLDYKVTDNSIIITEKKEKPSLLDRIRDIIVRGKVVDEKGNGLPGATIRLKGDETKMAITSSSAGDFAVNVPGDNAVLVVSYIGYQTKEVNISGADVNLVIRMEPGAAELKGVEVVSTGYQDIPKERSTGSFEKIDNALLNRSTGSSVLQRLENVTSGLLIDRRLGDRNRPGIGQVTIRGLNTLTASMTAPLVVLDNFPYEGDINNINPNDIESVTILKDAAAASIWGARAANGVIVLTTKKGQYNKRTNINFSANVNVTEKPDLMARPLVNSSTYIDIERDLFTKGYYDGLITNTYSWPYLSPVVELMLKARNETITQTDADSQIDSYRNRDSRRDYMKYLYRPAVTQQYALSLNGGSKDLSYLISGGYDKSIFNETTQNGDRITLRSAFNYKPFRNLEFEFSSIITKLSNKSASQNSVLLPNQLLPYARLIDENGKPAIVGQQIGDRFLDQADPRYLDWRYRPLAELDASYMKQGSTDMLFNIGTKYQINMILSAQIKYQYTWFSGKTENYDGPDSYYTRNLINSLTTFNGSSITRILPIGGILSQQLSNGSSSNLRGQINLDKNWNTNHQLNAVIGAEQKEVITQGSGSRYYGYNPDNLTFTEVDHISVYYSPCGAPIILLSGLSQNELRNRFQSIFANAGYTFKQKYTVNVSGRKDAANLYGVTTNLRGAPFWSGGLGWNLSKESFYHSEILPYLKLRATYGYQGNTNSTLSAFSTISYSGLNDEATNLPYADIQNPANSSLRWERVGTMNFGLDFGTKNNILSGSVEYYKKAMKDVLTIAPVDYTTGFLSIQRNNAQLSAQGVDINLSANISQKLIGWKSSLYFNYNNNKVEKFTPVFSSVSNLLTNVVSLPADFIIGNPIQSLYSYEWAGLDPETGDPMGYLTGLKSKDYFNLTNVPANQLIYHGSVVPIYSAAWRHEFTFKKFTLSANITGKFGYFFRRESIVYNDILTNPHSDFNLRWKKPGDEKTTNVPSMVYPDDQLRNQFYGLSSALVSPADHIRLQDINFSYVLSKPQWGMRNVRIFAIVSNVGILWRSNKFNIDPDYFNSFPAQKTISLGINANL